MALRLCELENELEEDASERSPRLEAQRTVTISEDDCKLRACRGSISERFSVDNVGVRVRGPLHRDTQDALFSAFLA
jgi:hypothetical protein